MDNATLLDVKDLEVIYTGDGGRVQAVNKIAFELKEKETLGLVGETGAGKTTTALAIMGSCRSATAGFWAGRSSFRMATCSRKTKRDAPHPRRADQHDLQDPMTALNPVKTVGDQVLESLKIHFAGEMTQADERKGG